MRYDSEILDARYRTAVFFFKILQVKREEIAERKGRGYCLSQTSGGLSLFAFLPYYGETNAIDVMMM